MNSNTAERIKVAEKAYKDGLMKGAQDGFMKGAKHSSDLFCDALLTLQQLEGIGPKRYQAILKHFGYNDKSELEKENRW